jgi:predicted phosphodiesterase
MMRLAVMADIHGNLHALEAVLADLDAAGGADRTWVLGDLCLYGSRPAECLRRIRDLPGVEAIMGNGDHYMVTGARLGYGPVDEAGWATFSEELRQREAYLTWALDQLTFAEYSFLAGLRPELEMNAPGYGWVIGYHGKPGDEEGLICPDTPADEVLDSLLDRQGRMALGAHTHRAMDRELGRWRVVNPGSVGLSRGDRLAWYAIITFADGTADVQLRQVAYDLEAAIADMRARGCPFTDEIARILLGDR